VTEAGENQNRSSALRYSRRGKI